MPKNKFNQRRPTQEETDAMENYFKPLRPQPKLPADGMGLEDEMLKPGKEYMKKGGMTKSQKKVGTVMREFKAGKLHSGKSKKIVTNPKQAIAIALSEAGKSKMKKRGGGMAERGMGAAFSQGGVVRGTGAAIKGIRPAKLS